MLRLTLPHKLSFLFVFLLALHSCEEPEQEPSYPDDLVPNCFDNILNQGEETVDCGGPNCPECDPNCYDLISNQNEESTVLNSNVIGIDCGGEFCEPCASCEDGVQNAHWVFDPNLTLYDLGDPDVGQSPTGELYRLVMESGIDCGFPCALACFPTDTDGIQNGDEEGIDCGGSSAIPCPPPTCADGLHNGTETGIDCGDALGICPECPDHNCNDGIQNIHIELNEMLPAGYMVVIETGIDCDSDPNTLCPDCPIPTCFDGLLNGLETGIDCGGNCQTLCNPLVNCNNGIMDGAETGIDCDDDQNTPCPTCPTCTDGIKNGPEVDVDCLDYPIPGYEDCPICPSCHDGIHNTEEDFLYELDVDCGGPYCEPCNQYVIIELIGTDNPTGFTDQYTYNRQMAASGNTDTLELDHYLYPGLKVEKVQNFGFGEPHLKITANQGFLTASNDIYIRTVVIYQRYPEILGPDGAEGLADLGMPTFGICLPIPIYQLPFVAYRETLVNSTGSYLCMTSYEAPLDPDYPLITEESTLTIDYLFGTAQIGQYYTKGNIDIGSLHSKQFDGTMLEGEFVDIRFAVQYPFFE